MEISYLQQINLFLYSIILGGVICLIENIFYALRNIFFTGKIATFFLDIIFFAIVGVIIFCYSLMFNNGIVRLFVWIGVAIGFFVIFFTVSKSFKIFFCFLGRSLKTFTCRINRRFKEKNGKIKQSKCDCKKNLKKSKKF